MTGNPLSANFPVPGSDSTSEPRTGGSVEAGAANEAVAADSRTVARPIWNRWAPDALHSPLAPAELVEAFNRWQPDHLKIRRAQ